jgi:hypothetical protein
VLDDIPGSERPLQATRLIDSLSIIPSMHIRFSSRNTTHLAN